MRRESRWQPKPPARFGSMTYCLEANVNLGVVRFVFLRKGGKGGMGGWGGQKVFPAIPYADVLLFTPPPTKFYPNRKLSKFFVWGGSGVDREGGWGGLNMGRTLCSFLVVPLQK